MLDAAGEHVRLERPQLVRDPVDDEGLHALEDDPELLVRMAVRRHRGSRLEADQVHHRVLSEERATRDSRDELEGANLVEVDELRLHAARLSLPA